MIRRIEALRYRSLLHLEREVGRLQVLLGPNGSGKSTFLDVVDFLGELVAEGVESTALERAPDWHDLLWRGEGDCFELAVEADVPSELRDRLPDAELARCRYQIALGAAPGRSGRSFGIREETLGLRPARDDEPDQQGLFPDGVETPETILRSFKTRDTKTVVHKIPEGRDHFYDETGGGWSPTFKLGPGRSALANLPDDPSKFPVASWFKRYLVDDVSRIALEPEVLKRPAPPARGDAFRSDGANLPWVVRRLAEEEPEAFEEWHDGFCADHPNVSAVTTTVRQEDRHCYLTVEHPSGHRVHSWGLSEGTLRSIAYSLIPYAPGLQGTLLVEEPEDGIHADGVRAVYESFRAADGVQVLASTHSPVVEERSRPGERLAFATDERGATRIETPDD